MLLSGVPNQEGDKIIKLANTIAMQQDVIDAQKESNALLSERVKQLESQLNSK